MSSRYDIIIVGGGAVGGSLACALSRCGFSVCLLEKTATDGCRQPAFDERHLAFSRSTKIALEGIGIWQGIQAFHAISTIHVSSQRRFGAVVFDAMEEGYEALGYVVSAREVGRAVYQGIADDAAITLIAPAEICDIDLAGSQAVVSVKADGGNIEKTLSASLLIAADGANSVVREMSGIPHHMTRYTQCAVIANLQMAQVEPGQAFERFTHDGAFALLPGGSSCYAVVCVVSSERADDLMAMDGMDFHRYLKAVFPERLSALTSSSKRTGFPLSLTRSGAVYRDKLVLVGNAAHSIHPVAAQGFNLSMRDIAALVEILVHARSAGMAIGTPDVLSRYADWRKRDEKVTVAFTDGLTHIFGDIAWPVSGFRQASMLALRYCPALRHRFARFVTGRMGRQAKLMRGGGLPVA